MSAMPSVCNRRALRVRQFGGGVSREAGQFFEGMNECACVYTAFQFGFGWF